MWDSDSEMTSSKSIASNTIGHFSKMFYFEMQTFFPSSTMFFFFFLTTYKIFGTFRKAVCWVKIKTTSRITVSVLLYASHYLRGSCTFTEAASTAGMVWQKVVVVLKPFQTALYLETNSQPLTAREGAKFKNLAVWILYVLVGGEKRQYYYYYYSIVWKTLNSQRPFSKQAAVPLNGEAQVQTRCPCTSSNINTHHTTPHTM